MSGIAFVLILVVLVLATSLKILREWERGVILRLGKFQAVRGPGITFVIPLIERMYRINTRVVTVDVPPQDIITKDNVTLNVNAVVFFRVFNPKDAVVNVEAFSAATSQKAQTAAIMGPHPISLPLRFLQTLAAVARDNNATLVFPLPIDLVQPLLELSERTSLP